MVAPPDQEPGVGGAGVGGLHQSIDALISEHHQNWQAGHLDVTLQTKQNIESTNISIWIQGSLADFFWSSECENILNFSKNFCRQQSQRIHRENRSYWRAISVWLRNPSAQTQWSWSPPWCRSFPSQCWSGNLLERSFLVKKKNQYLELPEFFTYIWVYWLWRFYPSLRLAKIWPILGQKGKSRQEEENAGDFFPPRPTQ